MLVTLIPSVHLLLMQWPSDQAGNCTRQSHVPDYTDGNSVPAAIFHSIPKQKHLE